MLCCCSTEMLALVMSHKRVQMNHASFSFPLKPLCAQQREASCAALHVLTAALHWAATACTYRGSFNNAGVINILKLNINTSLQPASMRASLSERRVDRLGMLFQQLTNSPFATSFSVIIIAQRMLESLCCLSHLQLKALLHL